MGLFSFVGDLFGFGDAPDTSGINDQARASAALSKEQFDWFKQEYERTRPEREAAVTRDNAVADSQVAGMNFATEEAKKAAERNRTVFQPLEDRMVSESSGFDTPERRAAAAAEASAGVNASFGRAQQANTRAMMRMGATPGGTATAALMQDADLARAKAEAGATAQATRNVEQQGYARMADAVALGKGVVSNQATQQQIASNAGSAGVQAGAGAIQAGQSGAGLMQVGGSQALQGLATAGQLYGQVAGIEGQTRGQDLNFVSNMFSTYMRPQATSDRTVKTNTGKKTDGKTELAEINATPVETGWRYSPAKGGPPDDGPHTGPMAQSVRATMGEAAAPGGKVIDLVTLNGKTMAAVQALSSDVRKLQAKVARIAVAQT